MVRSMAAVRSGGPVAIACPILAASGALIRPMTLWPYFLNASPDCRFGNRADYNIVLRVLTKVV